MNNAAFKRCLRMHLSSTLLLAILLIILSVAPALAQQPAIAPAPTPAPIDSTRQGSSAADTIPANVRRNGIKVGNSVLVPDSTTLDKPDTVRLTAKQEAQIRRIVPKKATIRSLMLPGLGQAYNRQYYKIPFIYAGFGVMGYLFVKYSKLANEAATGYRLLLYGTKISGAYSVSLNSTSNPSIVGSVSIPAQYEKPDFVLIDGYQVRTTATAKNAYDTYRRYRDLNVILSVALWGINIVEANVAAHLKTFDLTDDISMRVEPNVLPGFIPGVRVAFTFK